MTATETEYYQIRNVPARLPPGPPPPHSATVHRWVTVGVRGIKLRAVRRGHRWYTCDEYVREFVAAMEKLPPAVG